MKTDVRLMNIFRRVDVPGRNQLKRKEGIKAVLPAAVRALIG
jgi:hypothetical protein